MKDIKRNLNADVAVIGGGTAGVFAAIAAARTGADTVLIEKNSRPGGTVTEAGVNFPGLFFAWGKQIIAGPMWEAIKRIEKLGGCRIPEMTFAPKHHWDQQIRVNPFIYAAVISEMLQEAGVRVYCDTMVASASDADDKAEILLCDKTGLLYLKADIAIDTTGDANLVSMCGYSVNKSTVQQPATLHNRMEGYDHEGVSLEALEEAIAAADLPDYITARSLMYYLRVHKIDLHIPSENAETSEGRTKLEQKALSLILKIYCLYRSIPELKNLNIAMIAPETGVRETCRIVGETEISAEDYVAGRHYSDAICYAFYPVDLHVEKGVENTFIKENVFPEIPFGALIPKGSRHILCAGRCISSDTYANSAIRVEAICMATGQAVGCAAAICSKKKITVPELPYTELKNALEKIGAIVPHDMSKEKLM